MSKRLSWCLSLAAALCLLAGTAATAQVSPTGTLVGLVQDQTGAILAGADVKVKDEATGAVIDTKTNAEGKFVVASLRVGTYTVTISMTGFATAEFRNVKIVVGSTYDLKATLEIGAIETTVTVEAGAEVLQTTQTVIGATVTGRAITQLPFTSRDTLDLGMLAPGAQSPGRPRESSFMGLPKGSINITYDGINAQDNILKSSDGFFTTIRPRIDSVEEFSVTTATQGAEQAGEGAVQIRFETKRGGNEYKGGAWWYHRNDFLNANYYFNNLAGTPRVRMRLNQFGYRIGGPIIKDKLFFFHAFDFYRNPQAVARTRTILTDESTAGIFRYAVSALPSAAALAAAPWVTCDAAKMQCTANLMQMAAANGFTSTVDSVVGGILAAMNSSVNAPGVGLLPTTSLFTRSINFNNPAMGDRRFPDFRFDWNPSTSHQFTAIYHYALFLGRPDTLNARDPTFPVAPFNTNIGSQNSNRNQMVGAWRWNLAANKSNELRFGVVSAPIAFFNDMKSDIYPQITTNLGAIRIRPVLTLVSQPFLVFGAFPRNTALGQLIETFSWTRGRHLMTFGGSFTKLYGGITSSDAEVATLNLGMVSSDPAQAMFGATNLPGSTSTDRTDAQDLYGMLAGRVTSYSGLVYVNEKTKQFETGVALRERYEQFEFGLYGQDNWRLRPTLTMNYGLRWEYQGAPVETNGIFYRAVGGAAALYGVSGTGNLFRPGTLSGTIPSYELNNGRSWYDADLINFAPNVGLAWQPAFDNPLWNKIFGGPAKSVFRAGYSISFTREGTNNWLTLVEFNPGFTGSQSLSPVAPGSATPPGTFIAGTVQLQSGNLQNVAQTPASFGQAFPISTTAINAWTGGNHSVNVFDPNLSTPYVQSWSVGIQREISKSTVLEIRYVGNHSVGLWQRLSLNEVNIFENNFLQEFANARSNLNICRNTPGCTVRFSNQGLPGQVQVPILTAAFTGSTTGSQTNANFSSGARITQLDNNTPGAMAGTLSGTLSFWNNLVAAGYPANFWIVNPHARGGAITLRNGPQSTYNALQIEFRRRPSKGLMLNANYTFSKSLTNFWANSSSSTFTPRTLRDVNLDKGYSPYDLRHAFKLQSIWDLPFGPGRRWSSSHTWVNKFIEGWEFNAITRLQSGRVAQVTSGLGGTFNSADLAGVQLIGITPSQLQNQLTIRKLPDKTVYWFPQALLDSAQQAANTSVIAPCQTPGAMCQKLQLYGPKFFRADWSVGKRTRVTETINIEFRTEFINAFNNVNFLWPGSAASVAQNISSRSTSFGRILNGYQDLSTTDDPGGRLIQMVLRVNF